MSKRYFLIGYAYRGGALAAEWQWTNKAIDELPTEWLLGVLRRTVERGTGERYALLYSAEISKDEYEVAKEEL